MVGMEPTGHYWLNLAHFLREKQVMYGVVNPLHVKKAKNSTTIRQRRMTLRMRRSLHSWSKTGDTPYRTFPSYAELREAMKIRDHLTTDLCVVQARVHNWLDRCRHSI
ncbi:IS110 family transposase [Paenibacillus sp. Soil724D2]|uniref:IS110 family transposase n=1 Tax=Paenibacillus sp. (strain Soil724D2) TaxID=1736392 RepID=UPI0039E0F780